MSSVKAFQKILHFIKDHDFSNLVEYYRTENSYKQVSELRYSASFFHSHMKERLVSELFDMEPQKAIFVLNSIIKDINALLISWEDDGFPDVEDVTPSDWHPFDEAEQNRSEVLKDQVIGFLITVRESLERVLDSIASSDDEIASRQKLIVNLTVAELAYLFKALIEEKVIDVRTNGSLRKISKFVVDHFDTVNKLGITHDSLNNKLTTPEDSALKAWETRFANLSQAARQKKNCVTL